MSAIHGISRIVVEKCKVVFKEIRNATKRKVVNPQEVSRLEDSPDQRFARSILGEDFIGIEEVEKYLGVAFTQGDLVELGKIPFTEKTLKACKGTHILVPGYPLTALDIEERILRERYLDLSDWDLKRMRKELEAIAKGFEKVEEVDIRWYLMRKDIVPGFTNKPWEHQVAMLSENEKIPRACELSYAMTLYYLARGACLFESTSARCRDVPLEGYCGFHFHSGVGRFYRGGSLFPANWWRDDDTYQTLGIGSLWVDTL